MQSLRRNPLEDGLIEGNETAIVTLSAVTAGDLTTQLSATPANLTAQATISDDDSRDIVVVDLDLVATEGRAADTAGMSFVLAGMPSADVTLTFSGDSQCAVAPASMLFTPGNFATAQLLTITAIDDDVQEGSHSCQPTVAVTSGDSGYDAYPMSLSPVTIADDLVDSIREPLTALLQSDLEQAVAQQSRRFSSLSGGALRRLQAGLEDGRCGTLSAFDVEGGLEVGLGSGNSSGTFGEDYFDCQTGIRHITDGSFSVSVTPGLGSQWMLGFSIQQERQRAGTDLRGWFWGGYLSRNSASGLADGQIDGIGLNGGLYGAHAFSNGLYLDYYGAAALGHHAYRLSFADPLAPILTRGGYSYAGIFAGMALSGQAHYDRFSLTPRVGMDFAYAVAGDASVSAQQLGVTDRASLSLEPVNGVNVFVETLFTFNGPGGGSADPVAEPGSEGAVEGPEGTVFEIAPRLFCERGFGSDRMECGFGTSVRVSNANSDGPVSYGLQFDAERRGTTTRASLELSRERRFNAGSLATGVSIDHAGRARANMDLNLRF